MKIKFCFKCGSKIDKEAEICIKCGVRQPNFHINKNNKDKTIAGLLGLFLGLIGIHQFYLGDNKKGVIYLLIGLFGWILIVPPFILAIIVLIESIKLFIMSEEEFNSKYNL